MKSETYFVIHVSEDGDVSLRVMTKEQILKDMSPNEFGDVEMNPDDIFGEEVLNNHYNDLSNLGGYIIIKGEIVAPTPKKVVQEYDLP